MYRISQLFQCLALCQGWLPVSRVIPQTAKVTFSATERPSRQLVTDKMLSLVSRCTTMALWCDYHFKLFCSEYLSCSSRELLHMVITWISTIRTFKFQVQSLFCKYGLDTTRAWWRAHRAELCQMVSLAGSESLAPRLHLKKMFPK